MYANLEKCTFCTDKVVFLGFVVSAQGMEVYEEKITAVREWKSPQNVSQVQSFLGLAGFYRRFVKDFSFIAAPINQLKKKDTPFKWGEAQENAFEELNEFIESFPYIVKYKKGKENIVADALSRCHALLSQLDAKILGLENIKDLYANDSFFAEPFAKCCDGKD